MCVCVPECIIFVLILRVLTYAHYSLHSQSSGVHRRACVHIRVRCMRLVCVRCSAYSQIRTSHTHTLTQTLEHARNLRIVVAYNHVEATRSGTSTIIYKSTASTSNPREPCAHVWALSAHKRLVFVCGSLNVCAVCALSARCFCALWPHWTRTVRIRHASVCVTTLPALSAASAPAHGVPPTPSTTHVVRGSRRASFEACSPRTLSSDNVYIFDIIYLCASAATECEFGFIFFGRDAHFIGGGEQTVLEKQRASAF